jgi:hypothetical protein
MSTTIAGRSASAAASAATSVRSAAFVIAMSLTAPILYVLCDLFSLPLFTYHPATNRIELGWTPARSGEGPTMYWYGWTATTLLGSAAVGTIATLFPQQKTARFTLWTAPILVSAVMLLVAVRAGGELASYLPAGVAIMVTVAICVGTSMLSESANRKILLNLLWLLPILAIVPLFGSLRPFWEKGGWW